MKDNFFVIIPAYNEERYIGKVIAGVKKYAKNIIVVDDGSKDNTYRIAKKSGALVLKHLINLGKGAALKTGCEAAIKLGAENLILMDADGQHNPKHIPDFLEKLNQGYEIIFGSRNLSFGVPLIRYLGNKIASFIINLLFKIYRSDLLCGFIAFRKKIYKKISWKATGYGVESEIVARVGKNKLKYTEVPVETIYIDKYKGATIIDAFKILLNIPEWF